MNKKIKLVSSLLFLTTFLNCQKDINANLSPTVSPSATIINVNPSPTISPSATVINANLEEQYCSSIYCPPIDETKLKAKLKHPIDIVVTKDGKKVYALNQRDRMTAYKGFDLNPVDKPGPPFFSCGNDRKEELDRQFIYEIKDDKNISIMKVDNQYPFSCHLSEDIEIDSQDNLYVSKPIIDINNKFIGKPYIGHEIYKITPDKKMSKYAEMLIRDKLPRILVSTNMISNVLVNLNIAEDNKLVFSIVRDDSESEDYIVKIDNKNNLEYLIDKYSRYGGDFLKYKYYDKHLYSGLLKVKDPISSTSLSQLAETQERIYQIEELYIDMKTYFDSNGNIYMLSSLNGIIYKVMPNKEIIKFAGNGTNGYKDGKGEEAQFNQPQSISLDGQGNLFVADTGNNAIRKITPDGTVSTFYKEKQS